jgi:hypothetical protein
MKTVCLYSQTSYIKSKINDIQDDIEMEMKITRGEVGSMPLYGERREVGEWREATRMYIEGRSAVNLYSMIRPT